MDDDVHAAAEPMLKTIFGKITKHADGNIKKAYVLYKLRTDPVVLLKL